VFAARKFEVLFLYDPWDEFVMDHLREAEGKPLRPAERRKLDLADTAKTEGALSEQEAQSFTVWLKETFG